jgi:serine protease Do
VVLEYNGQRIEGTEQFVRLVHETPVDRQVNLLVWRNGGAQTLTATIGHRMEHFSLVTGDGDDSALTVEIPPMPPMPPMPAMPPMPEMGTLTDVLRGHDLRSGILGIECESLGSQLAGFFGVKEGVLVRSVTKDSAAEKAGIRAGDVIVKVDGEAVTSTHEITSLVRAARNKRTFPVVVVRDKQEVTLSVTIESANRGMRPVALTGPSC